MTGFVTQGNGFVKVPVLIQDIVAKMIANGFTQKFPTSPLAGTEAVFQVTLEAGLTIDPLSATQPWRVCFKVIEDYQCKMYVASNTQLPDDGTISKLEVGLSITQDSAGAIGSDLAYPYRLDGTTLIIPEPDYNSTTGSYSVTDIARQKRINNADRQFIDRSIRIPDLSTAQNYPMSYRLAITPRGFMLFVWEEGQDATGNRFSWVCTQRPVDRNTGAALVDTGTKCPVFCVYGLPDMYVPAAIKPVDSSDTTGRPKIIYPESYVSGIKKFVVREQDVLKPTPSVLATSDTSDSNAIMNDKEQVAITEDSKYATVFPSHLNTPRYAYTQELDLLQYTSADVVSQWADVPVTVYGEASSRVYKAMLANGANNTKMRILMISSGGGIS
jgi:hypothetical protein